MCRWTQRCRIDWIFWGASATDEEWGQGGFGLVLAGKSVIGWSDMYKYMIYIYIHIYRLKPLRCHCPQILLVHNLPTAFWTLESPQPLNPTLSQGDWWFCHLPSDRLPGMLGCLWLQSGLLPHLLWSWRLLGHPGLPRKMFCFLSDERVDNWLIP